MTINANIARENVQAFFVEQETQQKAEAFNWVEENAVPLIEGASKNGEYSVMVPHLPLSCTIRKHIYAELEAAGFTWTEMPNLALTIRWPLKTN